MLFLVDESWQTIGGTHVGALGAVALPLKGYNAFCREVFRIKRDKLGATELNQSEIKGQTAFSRAAFKRHALHGDSHWLLTIDALFDALERHRAKVFVIWTTNPAYVSLRSGRSTELSRPYKQLLFDFRAYMAREAPTRLGALNFDQRAVKEDEAAACALQNYLVRTSSGWDARVIQIPNFTVSSVSPGLQSADVMAHLGAHLVDMTIRPELVPYIDRMKALRYEWTTPAGKKKKTIRRVY